MINQWMEWGQNHEEPVFFFYYGVWRWLSYFDMAINHWGDPPTGSPLKSSKAKSCNQRRSIFGAGKFEVPIFDGWIWLNHHFDCFISPIFTPILGPNISTEPGVSQIHPRIDLLRKDSLCQCAMDPIGWLAKLVNLVEFNGWFFWRKAMTSWKIMKSQTRVWVYGFVKYMEDSGSTKSIEISLTHFKVLAV